MGVKLFLVCLNYQIILNMAIKILKIKTLSHKVIGQVNGYLYMKIQHRISAYIYNNTTL